MYNILMHINITLTVLQITCQSDGSDTISTNQGKMIRATCFDRKKISNRIEVLHLSFLLLPTDCLLLVEVGLDTKIFKGQSVEKGEHFFPY